MLVRAINVVTATESLSRPGLSARFVPLSPRAVQSVWDQGGAVAEGIAHDLDDGSLVGFRGRRNRWSPAQKA